MKKIWLFVFAAIFFTGCGLNNTSGVKTWADNEFAQYKLIKTQVAEDCASGVFTESQCKEATESVCIYEKAHNKAYNDYGADKNQFKLESQIMSSMGILTNSIYQIRRANK